MHAADHELHGSRFRYRRGVHGDEPLRGTPSRDEHQACGI